VRLFTRARVLTAAALATAAMTPLVASASTPQSGTVTVPTTAGGTASDTWTGTIPVSSNPTSSCAATGALANDSHDLTVNVPAGLYDTMDATFLFRIDWTPAADGGLHDEILTVTDDAGTELGSSDGSTNSEQVTLKNLAAGTYHVLACGYTNTGDQPYTGAVTVTTATKDATIPGQKSWSTGGLTFSRETVADPFRLGTEPNVAVSADGTVYESPIFGFSTTQSFIQRSLDGGQTFNTLGIPGVGKPTACTGGGDSDLAVDGFGGDLWFIDLSGAPTVPASVTNDHGNSFTTNCIANDLSTDPNSPGVAANVFTDRQWLSTDTVHNRMWYIYRDGLVSGSTGMDMLDHHVYGEYVKSAPLPASGGTAGLEQVSFASLCKDAAGVDAACFNDVQIAGNAVTDNSPTSPGSGNTYLALERPEGVGVAIITPSGVTEQYAVKGHHQVLFPTVAVDKAGNLYEVYTDDTTYQLMLTRSSDQGKTWTPPIAVNGAPVATTVMPWVVAGDAGRIDIVFYGTAVKQDPTQNYGPWYAWMLQSLNANSGKPTFSQQQMTDRPNHIDPICLSGLGCTTDTGPGGDRNLGDFFKVTLDKDGRAMVSFADGDNQLGNEVPNGPAAAPSFAHFVRQATGASLYAKVGKVPVIPVPTNSSTETTPIPGVATAPAPVVDLTSSAADVTPNGIHVRLRVKDLSSPLPGGVGTTNTYMTRWIYKDHVFFASAESTAGQFRFFAGQAAPVSDALAIKYAYYPAATAVTGTVDPLTGTIDITVPFSAVDPNGDPNATAPAPGTTLYSVTSYALVQTAPTPPPGLNYTDMPVIADSLPAYNLVVPKPAKNKPRVA
jgi:hypothetical protein